MNEELTDIRERWFNPATLRGTALVTAGMVALAVPDLSVRLLGLVLAFVLIFLGVSDVWSARLPEDNRWHEVAFGLLWIVTGIAILVTPTLASGVITKVLGALLLIRGVTISFAGVRRRKTSPTWLYDLVRGLFFIAAATIMIAVPDALINALVVGIALLAVVAGGVVISFGVGTDGKVDTSPTAIGGLTKRWLEKRDVGDTMRDSVVDSLYFEPPDSTLKQVGFWVLLVLSVIIATLGVLADSTAVVIGAMLVAPLMTPIMGVSAAMVNGWMKRVASSFATVVGGVGVAILVAWIVATWTPKLVPLASNTQILSRVSPTMIDLMIAMAAGAAGAYATMDRRVSSSITGVAIAVALVPPLAVVGITLEAGQLNDAVGAFLLFLTNLVSIILVGGFVFVIMGLSPLANIRENQEKMRTVTLTVALGALLIIVPLAFTSEGIITSATRQATSQETTEEWLEPSDGLSLEWVKVSGSDVSVLIAGEGDVPSVAELETELSSALGVPVNVQVEYVPTFLFRSDDPETLTDNG